MVKLVISYKLKTYYHGCKIRKILFSSVQFSSATQSCPTLCDPMNCSTPGPLFITNSRSLLKLMPIELVMPSSHLILCHPLLLLPPIPPSITVFSNESNIINLWHTAKFVAIFSHSFSKKEFKFHGMHVAICCSAAQLCPALYDPMDYSMTGFPVLHQLQGLLKLMSIESVMP